MAAALQDTLIHCIAGEKEEVSPIVIENKIKELEIEFDRLLVLAVDENDIIDHKLKQISETILKLKQQKKRLLKMICFISSLSVKMPAWFHSRSENNSS